MPLRYKTQMRTLRPAARWVNGEQPELEQLRGRPVLVHFWSLSAPASVEQMSSLREWIRRYAATLRVLGIHTPLEVGDMDHGKVADSLRQLGVEHPVALDGDDGALADAYDVRDSPAYFLFDAQLQLRNLRWGPGADRAMDRILAKVFPRVDAGEQAHQHG